ncbi:hypothetical protein ACFQRB_05320 [Halobaculum litoreum]|uniref:Uncharacterized protein n=1 Tax=Halobaculum litoreum TaxID=3031998 RepID=A0ABD5XM23_9EURY
MSTTDRTPSVPTPPAPDAVVPDRLRSRVAAVAADAVGVTARAGRALAFWAAALLPLTYLPILATGVASRPSCSSACWPPTSRRWSSAATTRTTTP